MCSTLLHAHRCRQYENASFHLHFEEWSDADSPQLVLSSDLDNNKQNNLKACQKEPGSLGSRAMQA